MAIEKTNREVEVYRQEPLVGYERTDFVVPRLKLLQFISQEVTSQDGKPGEFWDVFGGNYGKEVQFIPFKPFKTRRLFHEGELVCSSNDAVEGFGDPGGKCFDCMLSKWIDNHTPGKCALVYNFVSLILPIDGANLPIAITFSGTSAPAGKALNTMWTFAKQYTVYTLTSVQKENKKGRFFVASVRPIRAVNEEEAAIVREYAQMFNKALVEVEYGEDTGTEVEG